MSQLNKQQEITAYGYVHQNCKRIIQFALVKLIEQFYDEYFYWNLKGYELNNF